MKSKHFPSPAGVAVVFALASVVFLQNNVHAQIWSGAGTSENWSEGANWVGGSAPTGITADATIGAASPTDLDVDVNLNSLTVDSSGILNVLGSRNFNFGGTAMTTLTNDGVVNVGNNADLQLLNDAENNGTINLIANSSSSDLEVKSDGATLKGGGEINMGSAGGANSRITGQSGAVLTVESQSIKGYGDIGSNILTLHNQSGGTIDASENGKTINMDLAGAANSNQGQMQASNGGTLNINGTILDNTGGTIDAKDGSTVRLSGSTSITNGTVTSSGSGTVRVNQSGNSLFTDVANTGNVVVENNADLDVANSLNNSGSVVLESNSSSADLELQGAGATLSGGGTVTMTSLGGARSRVLGSGTLTIADQTIEGFGDLGFNGLTIDNQTSNLIDANVAGQTLKVDTAGAASTNAGTMQASLGGTLNIDNSIFDNSGGLIRANNGSTVRLSGSTIINNGTLIGSGSGEVQVDQSSNVFFTDVFLNGSIRSINNSDTGISGIITNNGTLTLEANSSVTDLEVQGSGATLKGAGKVVLNSVGGAKAGINGIGGSKLTVESHTIEGFGNFGQNTITLDHQVGSLVDANVTGENIRMDLTGGLVDNLNAGTFQASNGGAFVLNGTFLDNTGGTIQALDASTTVLTNSTVVGGLLTTAGTGEIQTSESSNTFLKDLTNSGTFVALNNSDTGIDGTITNTGLMTMLSNSSQTDLEVQSGGAILTGGGTVTLDSAGGATSKINAVGGSQLTVQSQTINGFGSIGQNTLVLDNQAGSLIDANVATKSIFVNLAGTTNTNTGTMQASGGGILQINGTTLDNTAGTIQALDGSTVQVANGTSITGGTLSSSGSGIIENTESSNMFLSDLTLSGDYFGRNNSDTGISGSIVNTGTMTIEASSSVTDLEVQSAGATLSGGGTVTLTSIGGAKSGINGVGGAVLTVQDQLINGYGNVGSNTMNFDFQAGSVLDANVAGQLINLDPQSGSLTNGGTFRASNGSTLQVAADLLNDGEMDAFDTGSRIVSNSLTSNAGSKLSGNGTIESLDDVITSNGTIAPGNSVGNLTLDGDAFFASSSILEIELESASSYDLLSVLGTADLAGTLSVDLVGFTPDASDVFTILESSMLGGDFVNAVNGGTVLTSGGEGIFTVSHAAGGVHLTGFTAVPEPGSATVLIGLAGFAMMRRRRQA